MFSETKLVNPLPPNNEISSFCEKTSVFVDDPLSVLPNTNGYKQDNGESECATINTKLTVVILTFNDLMLSCIKSGMRKTNRLPMWKVLTSEP